MFRFHLPSSSARVRSAFVAALLGSAPLTYAQLAEIEPANSISPGQPGGFGAPFWAAQGALTPGDVDFYAHGPVMAFPAGTPAHITASTFTAPWFSMPVGVPPAGNTYIGAFEPVGGLAAPISTDDDSNPGLNSSHHFTAPVGTPLWHGVTGSGDAGFTGLHPMAIPFYRFVVSSGGAPEVEPNNTVPTANFMPPTILGATANAGSLTHGDVDYYCLFITAGTFVTASVFDNTPIGGAAIDTLLGAFAPGGIFMGLDDNEGPALNSALAFFAPVTGLYDFAVTASPDFGFTGAHTATGDYRLVVSLPAPGVLALLALGGLVGLKRRR